MARGSVIAHAGHATRSSLVALPARFRSRTHLMEQSVAVVTMSRHHAKWLIRGARVTSSQGIAASVAALEQTERSPLSRRRGVSGPRPAEIRFDTRGLTGLRVGGNVVVAGIRPEQLHDAALLNDEARRRTVSLRARVDVIEWLGDERLVYVPYEASEDIRHQLQELGRELDVESARTQLIAKLSAATTVGEGEQIELAFDRHEQHVFDPATGTTLAQEPLPQAA
jgi:hypothetical protein